LILDRADRVARLRASTPGEFEVRLHGGYPKEEHHLLARIPIAVEGWPVSTGVEPKVRLDECLDRWLAARRLDPCGGTEVTHDAGGAPLFDSVMGGATRWNFVVSRHPDAERACARER
jgi:hypothetical protein